MAKVTINLLGYNSGKELADAIRSVLSQTYSDYELIFIDNASSDQSAETVRRDFPRVKIIENQTNLGYAGGHNLGIKSATGELVMVLNPDVALDKDFLVNIVKAFDDKNVAAATGKMLRPTSSVSSSVEGTYKRVLDGTGIVVSKTRRARERGQLEQDRGQYDGQRDVFGVSGTAAVYRKSALEKIKVPKIDFFRPTSSFSEKPSLPLGQLGALSPDKSGESNNESAFEYFDEDFFAYWEDLDLSWRLRLAGFKCCYVPKAELFHERKAGSSSGGYKKVMAFIKHHRALPRAVRKWNWKNHLFCIVKNDFGSPFWRDFIYILGRELAMLCYIILFEPATLTVSLEFFRQLPAMMKKRKFIQNNRVVSGAVAAAWFK
ncbi:MAG: glycosyltransferase family 2 protein [bacterium]|nr:glycosyltransferase family 2 protein [bacterium]